MSHPLNGIRVKLQRANENIINLQREISTFLATEPKPYRAFGKHEDGGRKYVLMAEGSSVAPLRLSVLTGEIIHHLRSVLDHLACALVVQNGGVPHSRVQFPIAETAPRYEELCTSGMVKGIAKSAKKLIRAEQPYNHGKPENTTLSVLNQCDIIDKHRLLLVTCTVAAIRPHVLIDAQEDGVSVVALGDPKPRRITEDGVELFHVRFAQPALKTTANAEITAEIAFEKLGTLDMLPIIPVLTTMSKKVSSVIDKFEVEFADRNHGN